MGSAEPIRLRIGSGMAAPRGAWGGHDRAERGAAVTLLATRHATILIPDPSRVIAKLFVPGEDAAVVHTRAHGLVDRIAALDEQETVRTVRETLDRFAGRHRDLEETWLHHYSLVHHRVDASGL